MDYQIKYNKYKLKYIFSKNITIPFNQSCDVINNNIDTLNTNCLIINDTIDQNNYKSDQKFVGYKNILFNHKMNIVNYKNLIELYHTFYKNCNNCYIQLLEFVDNIKKNNKNDMLKLFEKKNLIDEGYKKIDDMEKIIKFNSLTGGELSLDEFVSNVNKEIDETSKKKNDENIKNLDFEEFINEQLENIESVFKKEIEAEGEEQSNLFKIKSNIEKIIDQLGRINTNSQIEKEEIDFTGISEQIQNKIKLLNESKDIGNRESILQRVGQLEKYSESIKNISTGLTAMFQTGSQVGGNHYNEFYKKTYKQNFVDIAMDRNILKNPKDNRYYYENYYDILKIIMIIDMYNNLITNNQSKIDIYDTIQDPQIKKLKDYWDLFFKDRSDEYYKNFLERDMIAIIDNGDNGDNELIYTKKKIFEYILSNDINFNKIEKINNDEEDLTNIITHLQNTYLFYRYVIHIINFIVMLYLKYQSGYYTDYDEKINSNITFILPRTCIFEYSELNNYINNTDIQIIENESSSDKIDNIDKDSLNTGQPINGNLNFINNKKLFNHHITEMVPFLLKKNNIVDIEKSTNKRIKSDIIINIKSIDNLINKIATKLGYDTAGDNIEDGENLDIKDYNTILTSLKNLNRPQMAEKFISDSSTKPRLDTYRDNMIKCYHNLQNFKNIVTQLKKKINSDRNNNITGNELNALLSLSEQLKTNLETGINSYISIIPLIIYVSEFRTSLYNPKSICNYTFKNNQGLITYKKSNRIKPNTCSDTSFQNIEFNVHGHFLEDTKNNFTSNILDDKVIGLNKIASGVKSGDGLYNVKSNVIAMMFGLGASGTGKTVKYFGANSDKADERDKKGIISNLITTNFESGGKIEIAYFICYGRSEYYSEDKKGFNELLLFFNINNIYGGNTTKSEYISYIQDIESYSNINKYTDFYINLVGKKLIKSNINDVTKYIEHDSANFKDINKLPGDVLSFRNILDSNQDIWYNIDNTEPDKLNENLTNIFNILQKEQKKIYTVLPTKNNIASSRCHTCVLLKIIKDNDVKYFPLFDMAGTEDTNAMETFLYNDNDDRSRNTENMEKLIKIISEFTQNDDIVEDDNSRDKFDSMNAILENKTIINYLQHGGGNKTIKNITEYVYNKNTSDREKEEGEEGEERPGNFFLDKIIFEGDYINHTIGMLLFAAKCVGSSLNTELKDNNGTPEDTFDDFFNDGEEMRVKIKELLATKYGESSGKTKTLLDYITFDNILSNSHIWLHILFSFLYWNEETVESMTYIKGNKDSTENNIIIADYLFQSKFSDEYKINGVKYRDIVHDVDISKVINEKEKLINIIQNFDNPVNIISIDFTNNKFKEVQIIYRNCDSLKLFADDYKDYVEKSLTNFKLLDNTRDGQEFLGKVFEQCEENMRKSIVSNFFSIDNLSVSDKSSEKLYNKLDEYLKNSKDLCIISSIKEKIDKVNKIILDKAKELLISAAAVSEKTSYSAENNKSYNIQNHYILYNLYFNFSKSLSKNIFFSKYHVNNALNNEYKKFNSDINELSEIIKLCIKLNYNSIRILYADGDCFLQLCNLENDFFSDSELLEEILNNLKPFQNYQSKYDNDNYFEMRRVKDSRISATKMILMLLVTGEDYKRDLVTETIKLTSVAYEATDLNFKSVKIT